MLSEKEQDARDTVYNKKPSADGERLPALMALRTTVPEQDVGRCLPCLLNFLLLCWFLQQNVLKSQSVRQLVNCLANTITQNKGITPGFQC
jgi:hypothetical protein